MGVRSAMKSLIPGTSDALLIFLAVQTLGGIGFIIRLYIDHKETRSMIQEVLAWREDRTQSIVDYHSRNEETTKRMAVMDERYTNMMGAIDKLDRKLESSVTRLETKFDQLMDRLPKGRGTST